MPHKPELEDQWVVALQRISRAVDLHSRSLFQRHGLTAPQLAALRAAAENRPATVSRVARAIHLSLPTVTGIFDRLEKRQLVTRKRKGEDRRSVVVEPTVEGRRLLDSAPSLLQDRFRRQLAELPAWEQTRMLSVLQRMATMMESRGETQQAGRSDEGGDRSKRVSQQGGSRRGSDGATPVACHSAQR